MDDHWVNRFMDLAEHVSAWSKDENCKVGAVLVNPEKRVAGVGYNGLPSEMRDSPLAMTMKGCMIHAEVNAIENSVATEDCAVFVTKAPCLNCAISLKWSKVSAVYCPPIDSGSSWAVSQNQAVALLKSAKIPVYFVRHGEIIST